MYGRSVTRYVNLTDAIAVPAEWPADVFYEFLVPLAKQVINDVNAGKPVILQVLNTPAKLVQCQYRNKIQYFFEKVFTEELVDSYVVDVIIDMNDKNMKAMNDVPGPESDNPNALQHRASLNDYNIKVYRSEFRTAYYLLPIMKSIPTPKSVQAQLYGSYERNTLGESKVNDDGLLLLIILGTTPFLYMIYLMIFYAN